MELNLSLILIIAVICLFISVVQGWILAFMRYSEFEFLKKVFPGYGFLVKSHIDYVMMGGLLFIIYIVLAKFNLTLPKFVILSLVIGALYNPFGFVLQSIKPNITRSDSIVFKIMILAGFLPATIGFIGVCHAVFVYLIFP